MKVIHDRNPYSVNHPILNSRSNRASASKTIKAATVAPSPRPTEPISVMDLRDVTEEKADEAKDGVDSLAETRTVSEELIETIGTWKTQRAAKQLSPASQN